MRRALLAVGGLIFSGYFSSAQTVTPALPGPPWIRIDREQLCVTNGVVSSLTDGQLAIDTPSSRAVVRVATAQTAEIRFHYLGPSESSKPLASGELRRQIGLKLRAQDTCNLVYAMWHIEPDSRIAVSVKRNPGKRTHEECGARGYLNIRPGRSVSIPQVRPGEQHTLRAELRGSDLTLVADGHIVWEGTLGNRVSEFDGPVGLRTDNARFQFSYYAIGAASGVELSGRAERAGPCLQSRGD